MKIARIPLRVSLLGGGSDQEEFYENNLGKVLSFTINKYIWICINKRFGEGTKINYSQTEFITSNKDIKHVYFYEVLNYFEIKEQYDISVFADVPDTGTGLGSSSAFLSCLIALISDEVKIDLNKFDIAKLAYDIESKKLGLPVGMQDHFGSVFGGLKQIVFSKGDNVRVESQNLTENNIGYIQDTFKLIFTGTTRNSARLLKTQKDSLRNDSDKIKLINEMIDLIPKMLNSIIEADTRGIGEILNMGWELKKEIQSDVSNTHIESIHQELSDLGVAGGKLLGAGTGGFMLFVAEKEVWDRIKSIKHFNVIDIELDSLGLQLNQF
jgi:D-glycero-alpha-D-manno-heptose-7-phosphate kinase